MSAEYDRLEQRVAALKRSVRQASERGDEMAARLAAARAEELILAQRTLFGDEPAPICYHPVHAWLETDERGVNIWACKSCGALYPPDRRVAV